MDVHRLWQFVQDPQNAPTLQVYGAFFQALIAAVGIPFVWIQLRLVRKQLTGAKDVARAELVRSLGEYAQRSEFDNTLHALENARYSKAPASRDVRNYLRFLETVMLLLENGLLNHSEIFPLMGYRILFVINSGSAREILFDSGTANLRFCAIFALHNSMTYAAIARFKGEPELLRSHGIAKDDLRTCPGYEKAVKYYHKHSRNRKWWKLRRAFRRLPLASPAEKPDESGTPK